MFGLLRIRRMYLCDHFGAMTSLGQIRSGSIRAIRGWKLMKQIFKFASFSAPAKRWSLRCLLILNSSRRCRWSGRWLSLSTQELQPVFQMRRKIEKLRVRTVTPFFHCLWPLDHQSWPSGGLWSIWHCGFVSRPKDRDEVSRILARRTSSCVQVSVQVSIGVDNSLPQNLRFCSHLMGQQIFGHLFIHLSWKQISRPVEILRCIFFFGLAEEWGKKDYGCLPWSGGWQANLEGGEDGVKRGWWRGWRGIWHHGVHVTWKVKLLRSFRHDNVGTLRSCWDRK